MRLKRGPTTRSPIISSKVLVIIFIAAISLFATLNLSPESFTADLPIYHGSNSDDQGDSGLDSRTVREYTNDDGADVVEHDFSSTIDKSEYEGIEELDAKADAEAAAETEDVDEEEDAAETQQNFIDAIEDVEDNEPVEDEKKEEPEVVEEKKEPATAARVDEENAPPGSLDKYHVVVTVSDGVYVQWQARVCYYWYKKAKAADTTGSMGGFTRLLHSGMPDDLMGEIPTVVVDALPPELERIAAGYVVLNRPYGLLQWVQKYLDKIPEKYVLMSEPDHIFVKAPPLWATPTKAAAYPFFYINPADPENDGIMKRFNKKNIPIDKFAPIGNSPVMMSKEQIGPVVELWTNLSLAVRQDDEADRKWGWVQEMYAWSIASTQIESGPVEYELHPEFMMQPPWDSVMTHSNGEPYYIIHFTYGNDFDENGTFTPGKVGTWHFDKRDYTEKYPPLNIPMPPEGCTNEAVKTLIRSINEASASIPGWKDLAFGSAAEVKPLYEDEEEEELREEAEKAEKNVDDDSEE